MKSVGSALMGAALAAILATGGAVADTYPERPVRVVVPAAAGGGTDIQVRLLGPYMERHLGQPMVVINVEGGGTSIGNRQVKDADPDGYTALIIHAALHTNYALGRTDFTHEDYEAVAQTTLDGILTAVRADSPYQTLIDVLEDAAARPEEVLHGANIGGANHFAALLLTNAYGNGAKFRYVQTGGSAGSIQALLGGHVDVAVMTVSEARPLLEAGEVRILGVMSEERDPAFPDVPTAREQGVDGLFALTYWWYMPKGTPRDRVERFADALEATMKEPAVIEAYTSRDLNIAFARGPEIVETMDRSLADIVAVARAAGLAPAN